MSLHRTKATFIGLLEAGRVNEWVVTEKLGDILKMKLPGKASKKLRTKIREIRERYIFIIRLSLCNFSAFVAKLLYGIRLHLLELGVAAYIFFCGCYDILFGKGHYYIFLFMQSIAFFTVGVGYVGTLVPQ
jgi:beta-mannan synthase